MPQREEHTGIVRDNNDPEMRGRLVVECPTIVSGESLGGWVDPSFHFTDSANRSGSVWIPNIGSTVTVTIDSDSRAGISGLNPKWKCDVYPIGTIPEEFLTNYPKRRGWVTTAGHVLIFDDTEDIIEFYYRHPSGAEIKVNNDGGIILTPASGQSVFVGGDDATEHIPLGDLLVTLLQNMKAAYDPHTHLESGGGTTEAPSVLFPVVDSSVLSPYNKVK